MAVARSKCTFKLNACACHFSVSQFGTRIWKINQEKGKSSECIFNYFLIRSVSSTCDSFVYVFDQIFVYIYVYHKRSVRDRFSAHLSAYEGGVVNRFKDIRKKSNQFSQCVLFQANLNDKEDGGKLIIAEQYSNA